MLAYEKLLPGSKAEGGLIQSIGGRWTKVSSVRNGRREARVLRNPRTSRIDEFRAR